jgi:hypothetical protein
MPIHRGLGAHTASHTSRDTPASATPTPATRARSPPAHHATSPGKGGRKRTEEGYTIYREEELGLGSNKGGDTPLCPFDCDCCF